MRKALRLIAIAACSLSAFAGLVLACSSDDTIILDGNDSGPDVQPQPADDGSSDAQAPDADAPFDGGFKESTFVHDFSKAYCETLSRCCWGVAEPGDASVDGGGVGGQFDVDKCMTQFSTGFDNSNKHLNDVDAGNVTIDQTFANECVTTARTLQCELSGTVFRKLRSDCFKAVKGKLAQGAACSYSIECESGFCKTPDPASEDASAGGTCQPLRGADGGCGDFTWDYVTADEACSTRGGGDTDLYCNTYVDFDVDYDRADAGDWKCQPARTTTNWCALDTWCSQGPCDPDEETCADSLGFFPTGLCQRFLK